METKTFKDGVWQAEPIKEDIKKIPPSFHWGECCLQCFNCRQRIFRDFDLCREWVEYKGHQVRKGWTKIFLKGNKKITLYWCKANRNGRIKATSPGVGIKIKNRGKNCDFFNGE